MRDLGGGVDVREGRWGGAGRRLRGGRVIRTQEGVRKVQMGVLSLVQALQRWGYTVNNR